MRRLGKAVIDGHGVGDAGVEPGRAQMVDQGQRFRMRHVELARKAADVVHRPAAQPDAGRRHPVEMEAAVVIGAEQDDELGIERPHPRGLFGVDRLDRLVLRRFLGVAHQDRRMGQAEKVAAHADIPSGRTGAKFSPTNTFATDRLANSHRPSSRR